MQVRSPRMALPAMLAGAVATAATIFSSEAGSGQTGATLEGAAPATRSLGSTRGSHSHVSRGGRGGVRSTGHTAPATNRGRGRGPNATSHVARAIQSHGRNIMQSPNPNSDHDAVKAQYGNGVRGNRMSSRGRRPGGRGAHRD